MSGWSGNKHLKNNGLSKIEVYFLCIRKQSRAGMTYPEVTWDPDSFKLYTPSSLGCDFLAYRPEKLLELQLSQSR